MVRKYQRKNIDRPPTHKPPPPTKTYSYSDTPSISKHVSDPELMHNDTKEEPMTDHLVYYDDKDHHEPSWEDKKTPYHDDRDEDEDGMMGEEGAYYITSSVTRGSSFMSPAVMV
ncbi:hypothetical protein R3I94_010154 [Phoxinus phoxinus]|uniref:Uncharacterized protein n=1 Tax=Phoxinus phoxinus TaxID=58324 RepID=A0AAN9D3J3_9TELE